MRRHRNSSTRTMAQGLGYFSLALGAIELFAPRALGRALGMEEHAGVLQAYGARELATGIGILTAEDPAPWVWGRVAGDALDLATLAPALAENNPRRGAAGLAMAAVAGVTLLDLLCARSLTAENAEESRIRDYGYGDRSGFPNGRPRPQVPKPSEHDMAIAAAHPS